ncbi:MAG TPA: type II CAAX endopeptidase family protein [Candidatus Angelobacter sp.]|jgi:hypothetical protein
MNDMETEPVPPAPSRFVNIVFFNDRGLRAGWRLLIYCGIVAVFYFLVIALLFVLSSKQHRQFPPVELTPFFTIVSDGPLFLCLLLAAFIMARIERRNMSEYGLPLQRQPVLRRFLVGYVFWGFLPLSLCLFIMRVFHGFSFGNFALHGGDIALDGIAWAFAFLLVGLAEEYLLRGYALYTLADGIGFWPAAILLGILFGLGHSGNPGETRVGLIATVVFALFASVTLKYSGNLWLAVGAHAGWDWGQSFFYGVSDSGMRAKGHLLEPSFHGPVWLTGGTVGPEGSVITLILWVLMTVIFIVVYRKRREPALMIVQNQKY